MKRSRWLRAAAVRVMTAYMGVSMGGLLLGHGWHYFGIFWSRRWDGDFLQRVVHFAWLAVDLLDGDCEWHCCGTATLTVWRWRDSESHDAMREIIQGMNR